MLDVQYLQLTWRALFAGAIAALILFVSAGLEPSFATPRQEALGPDSIADLDNAQVEMTLNEVSKANTLLNAGKTAEANTLYDQALTKVGAQNKLASVIYCFRGLGYLSKEDAARALDDFNGAIKVISISEAQFPSAKKTAPNLYSLLVTAYNGRYMSCYLLGNYVQAAESQNTVSLLLPEDAANGHIGNAILYMLAGQGEQVRNELDRAVAADPKLKPDAEKFGGMWTQLETLTPEQRKEFTSFFLEAFKATVKPKVAELSKVLEGISTEHSNINRKQPAGQHDKVSVKDQIEVWEDRLKEEPSSPEAHIGLGKAFQARGDLSQAEAEFRQALFFDNNNATAKQLLEDLRQKRKP